MQAHKMIEQSFGREDQFYTAALDGDPQVSAFHIDESGNNIHMVWFQTHLPQQESYLTQSQWARCPLGGLAEEQASA